MKDKNMNKKKNNGPKKKKWMKEKKSITEKDMEQITQDPRFSHVPFDLKLREAPKSERTVKLDSRFSSMFSDEKFYEKSTMDPRGRNGSYSTKEDLRQFYRVSSEESESDDEEDEEELEQECVKEENSLEEENDVEDATFKAKEHPTDILERLQDMTQDYARGAAMFSDDSSDDDSSTDDEDEGEKEFEWGELDQDAVWDTEQDFEETSRIAVCNLDWSHIKAVDIMVVFNSFCPRGGSINKVTIFPSEFGKERMAEEDRFGPKELTTETEGGGKSIVFNDNDVDLDRLEKGKLDYRAKGGRENFEALRRYERNRLRYYYAVVECDSVETAKVLYSQCDRQSFERAGVYMDLRYIPTELTFDEEPHDACHSVPEFYEAKMFTTTALFDSQPTLTWDQTDPHRQKALSSVMKNAMSGKEYNDNYLKNFIASSSDEGSDLEQDDDYSSDDGESNKKARIANFRALLQEIDEKEKKKKNRFDMEQVFGTEEKEGEDSDDGSESEEESKRENGLNPFEKYLQKKRNKKVKKLADKKDASDSDNEYSDDDVPEDIKNDPFFAAEMKESPKKGKKDKKKKKKKMLEEESENEEEKRDLELLLMDEDQEEKKHFSMREIIEEHKGKSKKKLKKNARKKMEEKLKEKNSTVDKFKVDTVDTRFSNLLTSGDFNIDPSHPQFKRTKAIDELINTVQKKRMAENFENMPDPKRINTTKGREDHELSLLVKKVKSKTRKSE